MAVAMVEHLEDQQVRYMHMTSWMDNGRKQTEKMHGGHVEVGSHPHFPHGEMNQKK